MESRSSDRWRLGLGIFAVVLIGAMTVWMWVSPRSTARIVAPPVWGADAGVEGGSAAPRGVVRGRVVDAESRAGVSGASVVVGGETVETGASGGFEVQVVGAEVDVAVKAEGYFAGSVARVGVGGEDVVVELRQKVVVRGMVRASEAPVVGASLSAVWLAGVRAGELDGGVEDLGVVTGQDGSFALELPAGRARLLAEAPGFALGESREVRLLGGRDVDGVVIDMTSRGDLRLFVEDVAGAPVSGATVEVLGMPSWLEGRATSTSDGVARLEGLPIGEHRLRVSASRFSTTDGARVVIEADQVAELRVVLQPLAGVSGRVETSTGLAVSGALVVLAPEGLPTATTTVMAGRDGTFRFEDLEAGTYQVSASHPYYAAAEAQRVTTGQEVVVRLGKGGAIEGSVVDGRGQRVDGATVVVSTFRPAEGTPGMSSETSLGGRHFRPASSAGGDFLLTALAPGRYDLHADCEGYGAGDLAAVAVYEGRTTGRVVIRCEEGAWLSGRVLEATTRAGLGGATVAVRDESRRELGLSSLTVQTDADGSFAIAGLQGGRRSVVVSKEGWRTQIVAGLQLALRGEMDKEILMARAEEGSGDQVEFFGIGATLQVTEQGTVRIVSTLEGSPSVGQGLKAGDEIVRVDGQEASVLGLGRTVELIRGEEGTDVDLEVLRGGDPYPVHVKITRGRVVYEGKAR